MKTRSTTTDTIPNADQHRLVAQSNQSGDESAPVLATPQKGDATEQLAELAKKFQIAHDEFKQAGVKLKAAYTRSIAEVANLGRILIDVKQVTRKAKLNWMDWVKANTEISQKTAQRWMHVAKNSSPMSNLSGKSLTQHYKDIGILKPKPDDTGMDGAEQSPTDAPTQDDASPDAEPDADKSIFQRAKQMADRLAQLAVQTSDQERMAKAIKSIIAWHDGFLAIKKAATEKAEQDAQFDNPTSTAA